MQNKIKAIIKRVDRQPAVEEIENSLKSLQSLVGGYIEIIPFPCVKNVSIVLNEEGKLDNLSPTLIMPEYQDVIVGNFAVVGDRNGELVNLTDKQVEKCSEYLNNHHVCDTDFGTACYLMRILSATNKKSAKKEMEAE